MALNIDKKVYRNLQEQVGWLTTTVAEIIDITDPAAIKAAVDKIDDYQAVLDGFQDTMDGYALTMQGYANTMGDYATTMQGYANQVNTWTNNIALAAVTAISGQDITPRTVSQTAYNYSATYTFYYPAGWANLENVYSKVAVINEVLHVIANFKVTNITENQHTIDVGDGPLMSTASLPAAFASHIIDVKGHPLTFSDSENCVVTILPASVKVGPSGSTNKTVYDAHLILTNAESNILRGSFVVSQTVPVPAGETAYFFVRGELTLLD